MPLARNGCSGARGGGVLPKCALYIVLTDQPGGAERMTATLAGSFSRKPGRRAEYIVLSKEAEGSFSRTSLPPHVQIHFGRFASPALGLVEALLRLAFRRYDLVFTTHIYTNALVGVMRRLGWLRVRRSVARESTVFFDRFSGKKAVFAKALYRLYRHDLIVAQTGYMAEHIRPYLPKLQAARIRVLPNPVDRGHIEASACQPLPRELSDRLGRRANILFCGRLVDVKQPEVAVQVFARLRERLSVDALPRLVFMGDGPLFLETKDAVHRAGLDGDVVFLGQQSNPYAVMRACHYGLLTSSREGFPNAVLEMMACGLRKIVMTPCAGDLDTLTGVHVAANFEPDTLASALAEAIRIGEDQSDVYRQAVAARSVDRYLDIILGETPA